MSRLFGQHFGTVAWTLLLAASGACAAEPPAVAVAANLNFAMPEIAAAFARATGRQVKLAFGASGNFSRQIREGAPFELFLSADEDNVRALARSGNAADEGVVYAVGRLALFVPAQSTVAADAALEGLAAAVRAGRVRRLAIANPELAPYGRAAREALQRKRLWEPLQGRIVLGENVNQVAQYALVGGVDAALIPQSIVVSPNFQGKGKAILLPASLHEPIVQRMALIRGAGETARLFYRFMQEAEARKMLERYGFSVPMH